LRNYIIIIIAGILLSCKSSEKGFSLFSVSTEEQELISDALFIKAINEKNNSNYDKTIHLLENVIKSSQSHDAAHYELANIYQATKNYQKALKHIDQAVVLDPKNKWYLKFQIDLTKSLGLYKQTEISYHLRRKNFPNNPTFDIEFSDFYIQSKQYEKALSLYKSIEKKIGVSEEVNRNKYIIHNQLGEVEKAEAELKKLIHTFPSKMRYYILLGDIKMQNLDKEGALQIYQDALEIKPNDPYILAEVAHYYFVKMDLEKSFSTYEQVIGDKGFGTKDRVDLLTRFSRLSLLDNNVDKQTAKYMQIAGKAEPYSPSVNTIIAEYYFKSQKYNLAKKHYKIILESKQNSFLIWRQLLMCNYNLSEFEEMNTNTENALSLFPTQPELYLYFGLAKSQLKRYREAIVHLQNGLELVIDNNNLLIEFQSSLGDAYHTIENHKESDRYFELTLKGDPDNYFVLNNYAYYLSERKEKLELAKKMSERANELNPNEGSFEDTYGWILFQLKEYDKALIWMTKAIKDGGAKSGIINEHLGDVYYFLNQKIKALNYWNTAINLPNVSEFLQEKIRLKKYVN